MSRKKPSGQYLNCSVGGEYYKAFLPAPLPYAPQLRLSNQLMNLMEKANRALGRLEGITTLLPGSLFIYFYVRKEALLSSQIEGTQSSLSELLLYESSQLPGVPLDDVEEVSSYVAAMEYGLKRVREGFPICLRLFKEIHKVLLAKGRGSHRNPGEFRRSQNWVGGTRPGNALYVPPPVEHVMNCMGNLEEFIQNRSMFTPLLVKAAVSHVQFETIHPFLDGNGRLGRLLITLMLCAEEALSEPLLYLSLYFKANRVRYYDLLQKVRTESAWDEWLDFFLTGVFETSQQAWKSAQTILGIFDQDKKKIEALKRKAGSVLRVQHLLQTNPIISIPKAADELELSTPTVSSCFKNLTDLGIVNEITGGQRHRLFVYGRYLKTLEEGTEPYRNA